MAIEISYTNDTDGSSGRTILVYGESGAGKTRLIPTMTNNPMIIDSEGGLLSISDSKIPVIKVRTMKDVNDAIAVVLSEEHRHNFGDIVIDSITEISEIILADGLKNNKDPRKAYGECLEETKDIIRKFKHIEGKNVYMIAKQTYEKDENGVMMYGPLFPGRQLPIAIPYMFDTVMALRVFQGEDGDRQTALMCQTDGKWKAKDRGGKLDQFEKPDLGHIVKKLNGGE